MIKNVKYISSVYCNITLFDIAYGSQVSLNQIEVSRASISQCRVLFFFQECSQGSANQVYRRKNACLSYHLTNIDGHSALQHGLGQYNRELELS